MILRRRVFAAAVVATSELITAHTAPSFSHLDHLFSFQFQRQTCIETKRELANTYTLCHAKCNFKCSVKWLTSIVLVYSNINILRGVQRFLAVVHPCN